MTKDDDGRQPIAIGLLSYSGDLKTFEESCVHIKTFIMSVKKALTPFLEFNGPYLWKIHFRMLYAKFGWNWSKSSGKKKFSFRQCIFTISLLSPSLKKSWPFVWTNLNSLQLGMLCAKSGWNWLSASGEEDF